MRPLATMLPLSAPTLTAIALVVAVVSGSPALSQDTATKAHFWHQIAPLGDALYCSANGAKMTTEAGYSIEHIYPRSWMRKTLGCDGDACRSNKRYVFWESDLNNLWPALGRVNTARGDRIFGELEPKDDWRGGECGFRSRGVRVDWPPFNIDGIVEPPDRDKGIVARAVLYVHRVYGAMLAPRQEELLERWAEEYPVTAVECARQRIIAEIQALTNPYIVCPDP